MAGNAEEEQQQKKMRLMLLIKLQAAKQRDKGREKKERDTRGSGRDTYRVLKSTRRQGETGNSRKQRGRNTENVCYTPTNSLGCFFIFLREANKKKKTGLVTLIQNLH